MHGSMTFFWIMAALFLVFALGVGLGGSWGQFPGLAFVSLVLVVFASGFHCGIAERNSEIAKHR